ncbi:ester cyclase [Argonema galeatum]|uniref:ester cyclase n=1 Tax=Argonema galeatum TaxID=2942762 RepID=UPI002012BDC7|nr:ester cyclase [Argonema galeatum]MCL1466141.1 ester cyclase [Argonema galeatum A003/A1]
MLLSEPKAIVETWFQTLFTQGKEEILDNLVAPGFIAHGQGNAVEPFGIDDFKAWLRWYRATFTDPEWTIHDVITSQDKIVVRYSGWSTYRGGLLDIPCRNQRVLETGIMIFLILNDKVQELWCEMSDLQVVQQLGAFPALK